MPLCPVICYRFVRRDSCRAARDRLMHTQPHLSRLFRFLPAIGLLLAGVVQPLAAMSPSAQFTPVEVPARVADLAFSYLRAADFNAVTLPDEMPDFEDPTRFVPLQIVMASYGAVLFTVGARPAYGDGTVEDWVDYLARENGMSVDSVQPTVLGGLPALQMEARQESEMGRMRIRTVLLEDGTRMLNLSIMAPEALWASVEPTLQFMLRSFRLAEPRGTSVALTRAAATPAEEAPAENSSTEADPAEAAAPSDGPTAEALALATDATSFDPEEPYNVRLREAGVGFTPRVLQVNSDEHYAVLGAGAVAATVQVPFGWHVIDDGRRTLVFDHEGRIQVNLDLRNDGGDHDALLERLQNQAVLDQPDIEPQAMEFAADLPGLLLRNYRDGDDVLVQAFVLRRVREDGYVHVARVTAAPEDMTRAMSLAKWVLRSLQVEVTVASH